MTIGVTKKQTRTTATADATGQSRLLKNSIQMVWPIIGDSEPPSRSGMTNSPTIGIKHRSTPASMPDDDNGSVTSQKIFQRGQPRSAAASTSDSSSFSSAA